MIFRGFVRVRTGIRRPLRGLGEYSEGSRHLAPYLNWACPTWDRVGCTFLSEQQRRFVHDDFYPDEPKA